jgi:transposase-like protein
MSVPINCPECGEFCGEVGWSSREQQFVCPECGVEFVCNGTDGILEVL